MNTSPGAFRVVVFTLLIGETAALGYYLTRPAPDARTEFLVETGKNHSFLVDRERFPISAKPGQKIVITVENTKTPPPPLPDGRTRIPETDEQLKMATPTESRFRFYYDSPAKLAGFRSEEKLDKLRGKDDWETVLNVVGWSRKQFEPGTPRNYPAQNAVELLKVLRSKKEQGFCAQYCYITVQSLQALGFKARYVTIIGHEVAEVWVPSLKKWVLIDTLNNVHFEDDKGRKLSALEIYRGGDKARAVPPSTAETTKPEHYRYQAFWLRNDLFSTPVNIYDLNHFQVIAVLEPADASNLNPGDLCTFYPDELYSPPAEN
jgi:hypothetical protein